LLANAGRRRVHQGITLSSLLRAFRLGSLESLERFARGADWDAGSRDLLLFEISRYLLESFDLMSQAIAQAYLDEQYQRARWRDSLRFELCSHVFRHPEDVESFHRCAEAAGHRCHGATHSPGDQYETDQRSTVQAGGEYDRLALCVSRHFKCAYDDLVRVFHRGRLVVWVPCIRGDTLVAGDRRFADCAPP